MPSGVALVATGLASPWPTTLKRARVTPMSSNAVPRVNRNYSSVFQAFTNLPAGASNEFTGAFNRIRDVRIGPDGYVYLLTDEADAELWRLVPK